MKGLKVISAEWHPEFNASVVLAEFGDVLTVDGTTAPNEDGTYSIFLNARNCQAKRIAALRHELAHMMKGDFQKADVQQIESEMM